jgi:hypothetical protein
MGTTLEYRSRGRMLTINLWGSVKNRPETVISLFFKLEQVLNGV